MGDSVMQVLIAIDQLANTLFGGWADETLSSRAYRTMPTLAKIIDTVLFFDPNHCMMSYQSEQLRMQSPPELRTNK